VALRKSTSFLKIMQEVLYGLQEEFRHCIVKVADVFVVYVMMIRVSGIV
jgi:hypothetical protein